MSNTAKSVLDVARSQIGTKGGSKYWKYLQSVGKVSGGYVNGSATPWCAAFVSWVFAQAGAKCAGLPNASCTYGIYAAAKKAGKVVPMAQAKAGDVILFNFDSDKSDAEHVGIIEKVGGGSFVCIEGNTSAASNSNGNTVARRTRAKRYCFAIVRPSYATVEEKLAVDGICGPKTVAEWQRVVGSAYVDGIISGQYEPNRKWFPAISAVTFEDTGESQLVKICQKLMGIEADGYMGRDFAKALNRRLGLSGNTIDKACVMALQKTLNMGRF